MANITGRDKGGVNISNNSGSVSLNVNGDLVGGAKTIIAEHIENSFNRIGEADAPEELKTLLDSLTRSVRTVIPELPEGKAKEVAGDLQALVEETTKKEPRKEWYKLSAKGLVEAAKTVGEMGKPIVQTVEHIIRLLG